MQAFLSDIHGNGEALRAVLDHMRSLGVDRVTCLGDVVGYGPEPLACLDAARNFDLCMKGNHEAALLYYAGDFNPQAKIALDWTRDQINDPDLAPEIRSAYWDWLGSLPEKATHDLFLFTHGSPRDPIREYMLPQNIRNTTKMNEIFALMEQPICLVGHSHLPGVYTEGGSYYAQHELVDDTFTPGEEKLLVNVGSVGQPRDGDRRACYLTYDGETLCFQRVAYDFEKTMNQILQTRILPKVLALRLREGR